ncbi:soma ferritin-like isoform X3 [Ceratina calcarata]|uniref:Ferritin n=1 Tax=Ceratina calcarata TaxID=156304 RepID=A0AAJ7RY36_9HYME|nr:soma ferritin-like isoform X3 [Ceratina calcarata]
MKIKRENRLQYRGRQFKHEIDKRNVRGACAPLYSTLIYMYVRAYYTGCLLYSVHCELPRDHCQLLHLCFITLLEITMSSDVMSLVRQNFHVECEDGINKQINKELYASYVYLSMAYYFDRSDVALPGHYKYFKKSSDDEREHAIKFMAYQNKRGGSIILTPIESPPKNDWVGAHDAMIDALKLEREVNQNLLDLHALAEKHKDANFLDFLETEYLQEQVDSMNELANHVTKLERVGEGLGVYMFDQELKEEESP